VDKKTGRIWAINLPENDNAKQIPKQERIADLEKKDSKLQN
jgi:hypothetical protein